MQTSMRVWLCSILFIALIPVFALFAEAQTVPGNDFPYARFYLNAPPIDAAYPGLGNYYSAVSKGIETVMWNPASLTAVKHAQSSFSLISELQAFEYLRKYETEDGSTNLGDQDEFEIGYYLTEDETVTVPATREHTGHSFYQTRATGMEFKQAIRFNDMFAFGILTQSNAGLSIDMSGIFPAFARSQSNFYGKADILGSGLTIDNNGLLNYTHTTEGGSTYQYSTTDPLWSGFLNQSSTVPLNVIVESRNDISYDPGITLCGAMKWKNISLGASFTPISATANVNNTARAIIKDGTPDMFLYQPNFDAEDEAATLNWVQDPNLYGSEAGYKRNVINVPAGEAVGEARYKGFYQASALRGDIGVQLDLHDILTLGLVLENFTSSNLNFKGSGRVAYVNSKISTAEPTGIDPSQEFNWSPFRDDFEPVEGTEDLFLQEEIYIELPKKLRLGLALKKPFLIALDYEQNQTPIRIRPVEDSQDVITVRDLSLLRVGIETQMFALPMWIRAGFPLMFKPNVEGATQEVMDSIDEAFQFGVLPVGFDLGTEINFFGTHVGADIGINATSVLSLYQMDGLHLEFGKVGYYDIFVKNDPWKFTYLAAIDPGATAGAYANREDKSEDEFKMEYLRWVQTFTVSYLF